MQLKLNGTLVGIDAPEDVNESYIASFLSDAVTIVVAARYREKRIILPMFFGLLSVGIFITRPAYAWIIELLV